MDDIEKQIKKLSEKLNKISKVKVARAYSSSLNKTASKIKTSVTKSVSSDVKVTQKNIRKRIAVKKSSARTGKAKIIFYVRPINAINLRHTKQKAGYKVAGRLVARSFVARAPSSGKNFIWQRVGKKRLPIEVVKFPIKFSVEKHAIPTAKQKMKRDFLVTLRSEFRARLKGYV